VYCTTEKIGISVFLWQRFGIKGKLAPRYIGPYEIKEACGPVAYQLKLPPSMSAVHDVFHVYELWKCVRLPTEVLPEPDIEIEPDLSYQEYPIKVHGRLRIFYALASPTFCPKDSVRNPKPHPRLPFEYNYKKNLDNKGSLSCGFNLKRTSF
jgi:hypothetical protein